MKKILLLACLLAGITNIICAQQARQALHFGVAAQGILSNTDGDQLQLGTGHHLQAWLRYSLKQNNSIELAAGYRSLGGYKQTHISYEERNYPTEYQLEVDSRRLAALNYLDASLSYQTSLGKSSRWSSSIGLRLSKLIGIKGEQYNGTYQYSSYFDRITEDALSGGFSYFPTDIEQKPLNEKHFADYDLGIHAALFYKITNGLQAKASIYQGFVPVFDEVVFPAEEKYFISSFSLGFSAQIR